MAEEKIPEEEDYSERATRDNNIKAGVIKGAIYIFWRAMIDILWIFKEMTLDVSLAK